MTNIDFENFQRENGYGHSEKYRKDDTYCNKNIKSNIFTLKDWQERSENFISFNVYDIGLGDFININKMNNELDKTLGC